MIRHWLRFGADDYGMKSYLLAILKTGPTQTASKALVNHSFRGHLDNFNRLVREGKMIAAGPLGKNDNNYCGIFILNAATLKEAEKLLESDPTLKEGILDILFSWYGSAALPAYLEF